MKVSLITTVKNEEISIQNFLDSVLAQTKKPDEFIIIDGGSTDRTFEILKEYSKKYKWIRIYQLNNANISQGRNFAIKNAKNNIIACTDAGCILDKNWLREIIKPFPKADVVVGNYKSLVKNDFEYYQGLLVIKKVDRVSRMSSRSIAFKKKCWKAVGGYPEKTYTGEDTFFNIRLKEKGFKFAFTNALVWWKMRPALKSFARQFYLYGRGDKKTKNLLKLKAIFFMIVGFWIYITLAILFAFLFWPVLIILIILGIIYLIISTFIIFLKVKKVNAFYYVPLLLFIKRIAYIMGATFG